MASILIVDDDALLRRALTDRLRDWGHAPESVGSGEEAVRRSEQHHFDLILLDLKLPGLSGLDALKQLRRSDCESDIVVLTAYGSMETAVEAIKSGAVDFLPKPADFQLLRNLMDRTLDKQRLARVAAALDEQHESDTGFVVGVSPAMRRLVETADRAAASDSTILLCGESGVGKQMVAEYVHRHSPRRKGPFVYVNCVAISNELIESELFGHVKGAFTGAVATKSGKFDAANGGTIFLDEIGDVSSSFQAKLLHFLETRQYERVGGNQTISVDCRLVAATNRDLLQAAQNGEFRQDLLYRLNVIELHLPSLRERREDILALAECFIAKFSSTKQRKPRLATRTAEILQGYHWPGNVRQLKNAIERMVVLATTDTLTPDLLPAEIWRPDARANLDTETLPLRDAMIEFKRQYIARVLSESGGNQTRAAKQLDVQRTFLNRLIKKHGIPKNSAHGV